MSVLYIKQLYLLTVHTIQYTITNIYSYLINIRSGKTLIKLISSYTCIMYLSNQVPRIFLKYSCTATAVIHCTMLYNVHYYNYSTVANKVQSEHLTIS